MRHVPRTCSQRFLGGGGGAQGGGLVLESSGVFTLSPYCHYLAWTFRTSFWCVFSIYPLGQKDGKRPTTNKPYSLTLRSLDSEGAVGQVLGWTQSRKEEGLQEACQGGSRKALSALSWVLKRFKTVRMRSEAPNQLHWFNKYLLFINYHVPSEVLGKQIRICPHEASILVKVGTDTSQNI